jgi:hypothetical protein
MIYFLCLAVWHFYISFLHFILEVTLVSEALCEAKETRGEKEKPPVTSVENPTSTLD